MRRIQWLLIRWAITTIRNMDHYQAWFLIIRLNCTQWQNFIKRNKMISKWRSSGRGSKKYMSHRLIWSSRNFFSKRTVFIAKIHKITIRRRIWVMNFDKIKFRTNRYLTDNYSTKKRVNQVSSMSCLSSKENCLK